MTLREVLQQAMARLQQAGIPEARLDAEYLVAEAASIPRLQLVLQGALTLAPDRKRHLDTLIKERLDRKPLAYILGEQPFLNLTLRVSPVVLIPRPETELLVEEAFNVLGQRTQLTVVDVGTGSGNIALSLATHPAVGEVHAIDISPAALNLAQQNALRNHVSTPIHWHQGDLLTPLIQADIRADLIVANLPYVRRGELAGLSPEVRWEPTLALDGGPDGLAYISQLIDQTVYILKKGGSLLLEIGSDQGPEVLALLGANRIWNIPCLYSDLAGLPRIIRVEKGVLVGSLNH